MARRTRKSDHNIEKETARDELRRGNPKFAMDFNRQVQERARGSNRCGGCVGAGTGGRCCMCGKERGCGEQVGASHPCALPADHRWDMHGCGAGCCSWGSYTPRRP